MNKEKTFIYAVCGDDEYIDSLNISLKTFAKRSKANILVVSDLSRNKKKIEYDKVINIEVDKSLNNHQASIFLKTSLHRYVDIEKGKFCYIDSDILAISNEVDSIFDEDFQTIAFCTDNVRLDYFSPYAVKCNCVEEAKNRRDKLSEAQNEYKTILDNWSDFCKNEESRKLKKLLDDCRKKPWEHLSILIPYFIKKQIGKGEKIYFDKYFQERKTKGWYSKDGTLLLYPMEKFEDFVSRKTGFIFSTKNNFWTLQNDNHDVTVARCTHLHQAIKKDFGYEIEKANWQHANGGLFLFNRKSIDFFESWHSQTLEIFNNDFWKTRDQGTLAACFRKFGIDESTFLDKKYNFILDTYKGEIMYDANKGFSIDSGINYHKPLMIHVFHRFGDKNWSIWNVIENEFL
ncbi:MAG: hypothetical protein GX140_03680 [Bacteroidales bacterium]|jgi:hypothetical protein|nr:hypothetical protein [Bacteroidales bacterium]